LPSWSSSSAARAAASAAAALALAAAGCGGGGSTAPPQTRARTPQQERGRALFIRSCSACHTLADADAHGSVGSNLDATKPSVAIVLRSLAVPPSGMPTHLLSNAEDAKAVAAYVAAVTRAR